MKDEGYPRVGSQIYTYAWGNNPRRAELKGRRCVVEIQGTRMWTVLVRFLDTGERVTTSVRALRPVPGEYLDEETLL